MHTRQASSDEFNPKPALDFAWLELTNRCNLTCIHCYAESGPYAGQDDVLDEDKYKDLLDDIFETGCRRVQFIGGEPTLNRSLPALIVHAYERGYDFIEIFTNLYHLNDDLLECFCRNGVSVATSFYSWQPATHDNITQRSGSFDKTVRNMKRIISSRVPLRVGIILMEENKEHAADTRHFLEQLGVCEIGFDHIRHIGRASEDACCGVGELCGSCAGGSISIGPDGRVAPCTMSKHLTVGSVLEQPLADILTSQRLTDIRREIYDAIIVPSQGATKEAAGCKPCGPNGGPCTPNGRAPLNVDFMEASGCRPCGPNGGPCTPNGRVWPR